MHFTEFSLIIIFHLTNSSMQIWLFKSSLEKKKGSLDGVVEKKNNYFGHKRKEMYFIFSKIT